MKKHFTSFILLLSLSFATFAQEVKWINIYSVNEWGASLTSLDKDREENLYFSLNYTVKLGYLQGYMPQCKIFGINAKGETILEIQEGNSNNDYWTSLNTLKASNNNLYIGGQNVSLTKRDLSGNLIYLKELPRIVGIAERNNTLYLAGQYGKLIKSDTEGNYTVLEDLGPGIENEKVAVSNDAIYFAYRRISGSQRILRKYNFNGNIIWQVQIPLFYRDLKTDDEGNVYVAGSYIDGSGAIIKYKPNGEVDWIFSSGDFSFYSCIIEKGIVHLTGTIRPPSGSANDVRSIYSTVDSNTGELISSIQLQIFVDQPNHGIHIIKHSNKIYIGGTVGGQFAKAFLAKIEIEEEEDVVEEVEEESPESPASIETKQKEEGSFNIYPNPAPKEFTIDFSNPSSGKIKINLLNHIGQNVFSKEVFSNTGYHKEIINLSGAAPGVYFVTIQIGDAVERRKVMIE
jgi:hypothetical protein